MAYSSIWNYKTNFVDGEFVGYKKLKTLVESGQYSINPLEGILLGIFVEPRVKSLEPITDWKTFRRSLMEDYELDRDYDVIQIVAALEYKRALESTGKKLYCDDLAQAWVEGKVYSDLPELQELLGAKEGSEESMVPNSFIVNEQVNIDVEHTAIGINGIPLSVWVRERWLKLSEGEFQNMFSNLRHLTDDEDKEVYSLPTAYTVWMKWTSEGYSLVNPAQLPRISYYECSADGAVVYQPHEVWGNVLIHLLLNGLSRDSFGRLFRQKGTQLTVPIQVYGNKSEYNNIVETHKPGHIEIKPNLHKMVGLTIENGEDIQGTAKAYEAYNALEIPSFPQHQGEDLRILDAATASLVSLVKMGDIPIYIFARSVDKVTKLFNRLSLLNRVGTEGVCSCDPDDM